MTLGEFFFSPFPSHSEVKKQDPSCSLNGSEEHAVQKGRVWGALKEWRSWPLQGIYGCWVPWVHVGDRLLAESTWPSWPVSTSGLPVRVSLWGDAAAHVESAGHVWTHSCHLDPCAFPFRCRHYSEISKSPILEFFAPVLILWLMLQHLFTSLQYRYY